MFDYKNPPFMVIPIEESAEDLFPLAGGYITHNFKKGMKLVSFRDGWVFPLDLKQRSVLTEPPLLLVRDKGRITSESSFSRKGYAHRLVNPSGRELDIAYRHAIFVEKSENIWLLLHHSVDVIWLQYEYHSELLGNSAELKQQTSGVALIIRFTIERDYGPRLDKNADDPSQQHLLYRVKSETIFRTSWNLEEFPDKFLQERLRTEGLPFYIDDMHIALEIAAGYKKSPQL